MSLGSLLRDSNEGNVSSFSLAPCLCNSVNEVLCVLYCLDPELEVPPRLRHTTGGTDVVANINQD